MKTVKSAMDALALATSGGLDEEKLVRIVGRTPGACVVGNGNCEKKATDVIDVPGPGGCIFRHDACADCRARIKGGPSRTEVDVVVDPQPGDMVRSGEVLRVVIARDKHLVTWNEAHTGSLDIWGRRAGHVDVGASAARPAGTPELPIWGVEVAGPSVVRVPATT